MFIFNLLSVRHNDSLILLHGIDPAWNNFHRFKLSQIGFSHIVVLE